MSLDTGRRTDVGDDHWQSMRIWVGVALVIVVGILATALPGRGNYPNLHTILDTGLGSVASVLALLLLDMSIRTRSALAGGLAVSFAVTALLEIAHVLVVVEWSGWLAPLAQIGAVLRPMTWPPAAYVLPIGIVCSVLLPRQNGQGTRLLAMALTVFSVVLLLAFYRIPPYTPPAVFGITRPALAGVPLLWGVAGLLCWNRRALDRLLPALALMSGVLFLSQLAILYSHTPHDTPAMTAHLGAVSGYLVFLMSVAQMAANDLLELRQERQEALVNQQLLRGIIESSDDAIISKTLQGVITSWNPSAERLFGFSAEEAVGQPMMIVIPPQKAAEEGEFLARLSRGESIDHFETVRVRKDGTRIDISASLSPIRNDAGRIVGISKIARDITERKRAEARLRAQLARLDLLQRITRAIGERQDLNSILRVLLHSLEDHLPIDFGCVCSYREPEEAMTVICVGTRSRPLALQLSMPEQTSIDIDDNGLSRCIQGQLVYESDVGASRFPFPQRLAGGGLRSVVIAPLRVESSVFGVLVAARREPHGFSSSDCEFLQQLSEHVALAAHQAQIYAALQQAYDELRQTQRTAMQQERLRALGQMSSGIAHDINNAMSPATLYLELLLDNEKSLSEDARHWLATIQQAIEGVSGTVSRMREFSRPQELQLLMTRIQLNELIAQVIELTRARWATLPQQQGNVVQLRTEFMPQLPEISGVDSEVRDAMTNLIFNAIDAMPQGGTLTLRTRMTDEGRICVEVCDTGIGMDEEIRRHCLEPFFSTKGERGTGLGLAMVYGAVQRHDGELEIDSEVGKGTTFRLLFPVAVDAAAQSARPDSQLPVQRLRILTVDDDPIVTESLREALQKDGHQIVSADGGQAGIDAFIAAEHRGEPFAVVITDMGMPYVDGRKVAAAVKAVSPSTPVILLTGWGRRLVADGEAPPYVDCVLSKPPKRSELREALARCYGANRPD